MAVVSVYLDIIVRCCKIFTSCLAVVFPVLVLLLADQVSIFWPAAAHNGDSHIVTTIQDTRNKQTATSSVGEFRLDPPFNHRHCSVYTV